MSRSQAGRQAGSFRRRRWLQKKAKGVELARIGEGIFLTRDARQQVCDLPDRLQPSAALHSVAIWDGMTKLMGPLHSLG